jgi:hypothetical protein
MQFAKKQFNKNLILPYNKQTFIKKKSSKKVNFNSLIKLSSKVRGPLFDELKIYMVLIIKWHFDFLSKTSGNPKLLEKSVKYFYDIFEILFFFQK